jgi:NACHT domain-containing protein
MLAPVVRGPVGRIKRLWRLHRESAIRRRLLSQVLSSRYRIDTPVWVESEHLPSLAVPARYVALKLQTRLTESHLGRAVCGPMAIIDAYERASGTLLVLGEAGAGKTHKLFELLRELLERARVSSEEPIPLYVSLGSWTGAKANFSEWLTRYLSTVYGPDEHYVKYWLTTQHLALVFDGLDELPLRRRTDCISSINRLHRDYGLTPIVVACRTQQYLNNKKVLLVQGCYQLQPLSAEQVTGLLLDFGGNHAGLHSYVRKNSRLRDLLRTPLFLQLAIDAYRGKRHEDIGVPAGNWRSAIIDSYLDRAAERATYTKPDADVGMNTWLPRLADHLRRNHETTFYPDRLPLAMCDTRRAYISRRAGWSAICISLVAILLPRIPILYIGQEGAGYPSYIVMTIVSCTLCAVMARKITQRALTQPPASRRILFSKIIPQVLIRWALMYSALTGIIYGLSQIAGTEIALYVDFFGLILVATMPAMRLMQGTKPNAPAYLPLNPGRETKSLVVSAVVSATVIFAVLSITLSGTLIPLNSGPTLMTMVPTPIIIPYLIVPFAVVAALLNGGAELIARLTARRVLVREGLLPKRYFASFHALQTSSVLTPELGGYRIIHSLVRDHLAVRGSQ